MKRLRSVDGIGSVDEYGEIFDKYPYEGEKGFKVVKNGTHKIVYSLELQKKLFVIPKDIQVESNEKVLVLPLEPIRYLNEIRKLGVFDIENSLGVFNSSGNLMTWGKKVKLENNYFQTTFDCTSGGWGLYTNEGENIFAREHFFIECIELNISNKQETVFYLASSEFGTRALFSSDKRLLIPWGFYEIRVNDFTKKIILSKGKEQRKYQLVITEEGQLDAVELN